MAPWRRPVTSPNNGHTAPLSSAQIVPFGNDFACPRPLYEIPNPAFEKRRFLKEEDYFEWRNNNMNKLTIPIVVILILAASIGGYFIWQKPAFPQESTKSQEQIIEDSPFGIAFPRENEMDELRDLNVGIVRTVVGFDRQWKVDELVNLLHENNISILMTIHQTHHKDTEYIDFVRNAVGRYKDKVDYWQIGNEVEGSFSPQEYANFVKEVSPIIRENDPEAKVVLGGMIYARGTMETLNSFFKPVLSKLGPGDFDIFDFHFFGQATGDYRKIAAYAKSIKDLLKEEKMEAEFWITEMAAYSGSPTNESLQTEKEQAEDLIKRYIISFSSDVKKVFWVTITEWYKFGGKPNGYFDNVGLVNNPQQDSQNHKKLAYYTYKKMVEVLEGSDWDNIQTIQESDGIYIYKFTKQGKPIWVAWNDNSAEKQITISGINSAQAKITEAVPKHESGKDTTDHNTAFNVETKIVSNGKITIILSESPIFVEEK